MHYTDIKSLDRCDSQQLKCETPNLSPNSLQLNQQLSVNTQINHLLQKISAACADIKQRRESPEPTVEAQSRENNIRFIIKQGKSQDQPHKPNVLSTSIFKKSNKNKSQKSSIANNKSGNFEIGGYHFEKNQQFYKYCTDEIVRVSNLNSTLQKNLQKTINDYQNERTLNENLKNENLRLVRQMNEIKVKLNKAEEELKIIKSKMAEEQRMKVERSKNQINGLAENTRVYEAELYRYRKRLSQKQEQNNSLLNQIKALKIEQIKGINMSEQIARLNKKIAQLVTRNQDLEGRAAGKSEAVDHLWSIKQIQYANIVRLIGKSRPIFQLPSKPQLNKAEAEHDKEQQYD